MTSTGPLLDPPLVGRTAEVGAVADGLAQLAAGIGGALRVSGEAGAGKTRLIREALDGCPVAVRWGAAQEAERGRPFAAIAEALDVDDLYRPADTNGSALAGDAVWLAVDRAIEAIETQAGSDPLIVVIDDLQWADRGTWLAAAALARRAPEMGVLLITMHRPLWPSDPEPVPLLSLGSPIDLAPLSPEQSLTLAGSVLGAAPAQAVAAQIGRAGGNPFFTIELARWAGSAPSDVWIGRPAGEIELSPVLRATVLARMDALAPAAVAVLRAAALMGRRTSVTELSNLTAQPVDAVARSVEDATVAGILTDTGDGVGFRHDLVRSAVRASAPPSTVAAHLATVASRGVADPWAARQLARHAEPGNHEVARVVTAAALAPGVASETVVALLEEVLRIGADPAESPGSIETQLVLAIARDGDLEAAAERGRRVLDDLTSTGADQVIGTGPPEFAELRRMVARIEVGRGHMDGAVAQLRAISGGTGLVAEQAAADLQLLEVMTMRRPDAVHDARALRRTATDPIVRGNAELAVAVHAMRGGEVAESVDAAAAAVAQAALDPMFSAEIHPEVFLANALFYAERFDEAAEALAAAQAASRASGTVWPIPHHLAHLAGAALRVGDLDGARAASQEAIEWSLDTGQRIGATWPHVFTAVIGVFTGDLDDARTSLALAEADLAAGQWQGTEAVPWAAALVAEAAGDVEGAADRLVPLIELAVAFGWKNRLSLIAPDAARMAVLAGRAEEADRVAELVGTLESMATVEAAVAQERCRALARGDVDGLATVAGRYEGIGSVAQCGTTWAEVALLAARGGDHDRSVAVFEAEARPRLEAIGAIGVLARTIDALPVRVTRRLGRRPARPTEGPDSLTPAERRIAGLVATGATNAEIAEELVVSRRTVESHLGRIYRKLGVSSRLKLAAGDHLAATAP